VQEKKGASILSAGHAVAYSSEKDAADFFSCNHPKGAAIFLRLKAKPAWT